MPCDNLTVDTGLSNGSWPIYVGFLSMLANIRRMFRRVLRRVFAGHVGPFTSGFCQVFVGLFGRVEPIYVGFWSWFCKSGWEGGGGGWKGGGGCAFLLFSRYRVSFVRSWYAECHMYIILVIFCCHVPRAIG